MNDLLTPSFLALVAVVLVANATQVATGFGGTILGLALGSQFRPIEELLPLFVSLDLVVSASFLVRNRASVDRALYARTILPWMGAGVVVGFAVSAFVQGNAMKRGLGVLVFVLAVRGVYDLMRTKEPASPRPPNALTHGLMLAAGVVHGVYATGGPLLVASLARLGLERDRLRATLVAVWTTLGTVMILKLVVSGAFTASTLRELAALLCVLPVGYVVGDKLGKAMPERTFRIAVYAVLAFAAVRLVVA